MGNFFDLSREIAAGNIRAGHLASYEQKNPLFSDIDFRAFAKQRPAEHSRTQAKATKEVL
jgi:hypothetical protein